MIDWVHGSEDEYVSQELYNFDLSRPTFCEVNKLLEQDVMHPEGDGSLSPSLGKKDFCNVGSARKKSEKNEDMSKH